MDTDVFRSFARGTTVLLCLVLLSASQIARAQAQPEPSSPAPPEPAPAGVLQASDSERPLPGGAPRCDLNEPGSNLENCDTPRSGTLSGLYFALDAGVATMTERVSERERIDATAVLQIRLGFELWDLLVLESSLGHYFVSDRAPFDTPVTVTTCEYVGNTQIGCEEPMDSVAESTINTGMYLGFAAGPQYRFRPAHGFSLVPGLLFGYLDTFGRATRGVAECDDCPQQPLDVQGGGASLTPFVRATFGDIGYWALIIRSQWFIGADLVHFTTGGVELGIP